MSKGILYIVSTPIGNLDDITLRAINILKTVDIIACEDTRHSAKLLSHYDIKTKKISYYDEIEDKRSSTLIRMLESGKNVALISDAGTPGISDPGYRVIQKAVDADISVIPVPGPSSLLSVLVSSGFATDRFTFEGFLPRKKGRKTRLEELAAETRTMIIFESPVRLLKTLADLSVYFGDRRIVIGREMTKFYEEYVRGSIPEVISHFEESKPRGEFVLVIEGLTRKLKKSISD
ncbi:16S rRNA (cytidine(1402)-2'-O)-methyltransferase [bacterium]|nr:16S rRNA (cytidine(1402)-2'-O)-methyltransferase [bacterium]MBU1065099.1 16S rRNA (cytidine(1402)-2'-O)-methyltransferase [bacterium]MBU1632881.1 16S rRNA (cytidine(1402)-2'-O)-methyltransferase [bacterium]MBU1872438.1 16S rRNA (cytidine(1402)-2'-O)-methyltransferase [bacterium]